VAKRKGKHALAEERGVIEGQRDQGGAKRGGTELKEGGMRDNLEGTRNLI